MRSVHSSPARAAVPASTAARARSRSGQGSRAAGSAVAAAEIYTPGLGQFTILAIQNQDFPEIMGVVMLAAFFIVVANALVDILYAVIDPRVRVG